MTVGLLAVLPPDAALPLRITEIGPDAALCGFCPHRLDENTVVALLQSVYGGDVEILTDTRPWTAAR